MFIVSKCCSVIKEWQFRFKDVTHKPGIINVIICFLDRLPLLHKNGVTLKAGQMGLTNVTGVILIQLLIKGIVRETGCDWFIGIVPDANPYSL